LADFCRFHAVYFQSASDADGDAVPDRCDVCPTDALNDADRDGVCGAIDACPGTPAEKPVDLVGCRLCGNGLIDLAEECEPPNTSQCDDDCLTILSGKILADNCASAEQVDIEGSFRFQNRAASTDGLPHTACISRGEDQIERDLWACWSAPCDGAVFIRTCHVTDLDTKIAVYDGCACPATQERLRTCNDNGCGPQMNQSLVMFEAVRARRYLIRVGSYPGAAGGTGVVEISCGTANCPAGGNCLAEHPTPGCGVESCCESVCTVDPYCCTNRWDDRCAAAASGLCTGGFAACENSFESCSSPTGHLTPGCNDPECCSAICQIDPFCCTDRWDPACAAREPEICHGACSTGRGSCRTARASPGCEDRTCCAQVCPRDPFCCSTAWDQSCVTLAVEYCP
jgi:hypothetical protein